MYKDRFEQLVRNAKHARSRGGYEINSQLQMSGTVDEVSILLMSREDQALFCELALAAGTPEWYQDDAQVFMRVLDYGTDRQRLEYAYHARFQFYRMDSGAWRIQTQTLYTVNPVMHHEEPMFSFIPTGGVAHVSWKVQDLDGFLQTSPAGLDVLGRYQTQHGASLYIGNKGTGQPLFHPRAPKVT